MGPVTSPARMLSLRQVSVAAQNIAAAQFALHGFDVLEQAGRARFIYDLGVAHAGGMMKIIVHGSIDGFWNPVEPYLDRSRRQGPDYHRAIDLWLERHSSHIICCLVQFESSNLGGMPRIYLASAAEIAEKLHQSTEQLGDSALHEEYESAGISGIRRWESLPSGWRFSEARIAELMEAPEPKKPLSLRLTSAPAAYAV